MNLKMMAWVFLGGGIGASARFVLNNWLSYKFARPDGQISFPWGILSCNLLGCFLIGILFSYLKSHHPGYLHPLLITGVLGGFTTFSSFALDVQLLFQQHASGLALLYVVGTLLGGIGLCFLGWMLGA